MPARRPLCGRQNSRAACLLGRACSTSKVATGLQRLEFRLEVTEAILNSISSSRSGITGVYQRQDWASEKRAALDAWAAHVRSIAEGSIDGTNVVKMARTA
jgi:hypothetical protein